MGFFVEDERYKQIMEEHQIHELMDIFDWFAEDREDTDKDLERTHFLWEYLDRLPVDEGSLEELLEAVDSIDNLDLFDTLFDKFLPLLSKDQAYAYLKRYQETFIIPLDEHLIRKFEEKGIHVDEDK